MSAVVEPNNAPEHYIDPENVRRELVRYLTTAVNYVARQGLEDREIVESVREALSARYSPTVTPALPAPELRDKGINDMRERMAN